MKSDAPTEPSAPATATDGLLPSTAQARVVVLDGPAAGTNVRVNGGRCVLGSDISCDVVLHDAAVSRRHAQCDLHRRAVRVTDLGSANGISYLGHTVHEVVVPYGATIRLGQTRLLFEREEKVGRSLEPELAGLRGDSDKMRQVFHAMQRLCALDTSVCFVGPPGSGKKAAARALHALTPRGAAPLVVFEPEGSADVASLEQAIAQAGKGALLIPHVGELSPALQQALEEALESQQLGCRLYTTSADDLTELVNQGQFDAQLYELMAVDVVELPGLDQRREDVEPLALRFAAEAGGKLSDAVLADLRRRPFPGNVSELKREVELMLRDSRKASVTGGYNELRDEAVHAFEATYLASLLERHRGNVSAAAREAKLSRSQFYRVLRRHPSLMSSVRAE